jgi:hypothetical protein
VKAHGFFVVEWMKIHVKFIMSKVKERPFKFRVEKIDKYAWVSNYFRIGYLLADY